MVLAETVQIDERAVVALLLVVAVLGIAWMTTLTLGTRVVYRAALPRPSGTGDSGWIIPVVAFDVILVLTASRFDSGVIPFVILPPALHGIAYLVGRTRAAP